MVALQHGGVRVQRFQGPVAWVLPLACAVRGLGFGLKGPSVTRTAGSIANLLADAGPAMLGRSRVFHLIWEHQVLRANRPDSPSRAPFRRHAISGHFGPCEPSHRRGTAATRFRMTSRFVRELTRGLNAGKDIKLFDFNKTFIF